MAVRNHARPEIAGVELEGQLFIVFTMREGQIVHLRDHSHRSKAFSEAGVEDWEWR